MFADDEVSFPGSCGGIHPNVVPWHILTGRWGFNKVISLTAKRRAILPTVGIS